LLVPPRSAEAVELPVWTVRRWLQRRRDVLAHLADIAVAEPEDQTEGLTGKDRSVFRWKGDDDRSIWILPREIRSGDTIIVPAAYGGLDEFGWNPDAEKVIDVADKAAQLFSGHRFVARVAPGLLGDLVSDVALANALATSASERWRGWRNAIEGLSVPQEIKDALRALDRAKGKASVPAYDDLYGYDNGRPSGIVFVARFGLADGEIQEDGQSGSTEDDWASSLPGFSLTLEQHSADVEAKAEDFARRSGLPPDRVADLKL